MPLLRMWNIAATRFAKREAVRTSSRLWTYQELDRHSSNLARRILELFPEGGGTVGIDTEHYGEAVVAILAATKAGRPFVFMNPGDSSERRNVIAALSGLECTLTNTYSPSDSESFRQPVIPIDRPGDTNLHPELHRVRLPPPAASNGIGLVFTSGTSGNPTGVMRSQGSQLHLVRHIVRRCDLSHKDRIAMIIPPNIGASLNDVFLALLSGATLCALPLKQAGSVRLVEWMIEEKISYCHCPPSVFRTIARQGHAVTRRLVSLRWFKLGGEPLSTQDIESFFRSFPPRTRILFSYGSTETGGTICDRVISPPTHSDEIDLSVGTPIPGKSVDIVSPDGTPLPPGEEGEIVVRSKYLSLGYFRDERRNLEQFKLNEEEPGMASFRTRDRGTFNASGQLNLLGRIDGHLKLNGIRINPSVIESCLREHPGISEAAVLIPENETELTAFVSSPTGIQLSLSELRNTCASLLPGGVFPSRLVRMESLPRLANGKVDRQKLRTTLHEQSLDEARRSRVSPRNELESIIAGLWKRILNIEEPGVYDDFFDLGGDSLRALNFQADLTRRIGVNIPLAILLGEFPTIAHIAEQIHHALRLGYGNGIGLSEMREPFPPLSVLRPGHNGRPIVFLPGGYGTEVEMMLFVRIGKHLNSLYPLCGFLASNLYQLEPPPTSVPEIAARYLAELDRLHPEQSPILVGNCIAGPIAHEMGRQLEEQGGAKGNPGLILIDSASRRGSRKRDGHTRQGDPEHQRPEFIRSYLNQLDAFIPGVFHGALHLLTTEEPSRSLDPTLGWSRHAAGSIRLTQIPGDHHESLRMYRDEVGVILSRIVNEM